MSVALISSTKALFRLLLFFTPPAIIDCTAIFEVNRSSCRSRVIEGNSLRNLLMRGWIMASDSDGVLFICFGSPTTIQDTFSCLIYAVKNGINSPVFTVVSPDAINCNSSVTAIPVRFFPKSNAKTLLTFFGKNNL